jgi:phosphatidylethanolamine/phosphatidyl-N-methylethanolamine N-methyltransferase
MFQTFTERMKLRFADELRFLHGMRNQPKTVGAVWPTGPVMARSMASVVDIESRLPVLELGPGTGVITKAILARGLAPELLHAVEFSHEFVRELHIRFPKSNIHEGDAFNLDVSLSEARTLRFDCAVSALPLLNFPAEMRTHFITDILKRLPLGRPLIQFSYGPLAPVQAVAGKFTVEHHDFILRNIPPARIWIYRQLPQ